MDTIEYHFIMYVLYSDHSWSELPYTHVANSGDIATASWDIRHYFYQMLSEHQIEIKMVIANYAFSVIK